jgi:hypothetical protein
LLIGAKIADWCKLLIGAKIADWCKLLIGARFAHLETADCPFPQRLKSKKHNTSFQNGRH